MYRYEYKDKKYQVLDANIEFKHPETGEWIGAVLYQQKENQKQYVRERKDFYNKFKNTFTLGRGIRNE